MGGHARKKATRRVVPCTAVCTPGSRRTAGARLPRARARSGYGCCTSRCTAARAPRAIASWCLARISPQATTETKTLHLDETRISERPRRGDRRVRSRLGPTPTMRGRGARQPAACAHHPDAHASKIRGSADCVASLGVRANPFAGQCFGPWLSVRVQLFEDQTRLTTNEPVWECNETRETRVPRILLVLLPYALDSPVPLALSNASAAAAAFAPSVVSAGVISLRPASAAPPPKKSTNDASVEEMPRSHASPAPAA